MNPGCVAVALICVGMLRAQQPTGELRLAVEDASGGGMQASGKIDDQAFQTDAQGQYDFKSLASGRHRLEVSRNGFATQVIAVEVGAGGTVNETVKLGLAGTASRIEVVDTTPLAGTDLAKDQIAGAGPDRDGGRYRKQRRARSGGFHEPAAERRLSQ